MTGKIFQRYTLYYRSGLLLLDREAVKFDLANEITIGRETSKRVQLGRSRVPSNGWNFIGNKYFLLLQPRTVMARVVSEAISVSPARPASIRRNIPTKHYLSFNRA